VDALGVLFPCHVHFVDIVGGIPGEKGIIGILRKSVHRSTALLKLTTPFSASLSDAATA